MHWLAILLSGLAAGWALEFIIDVWYWGRRNRKLGTELDKYRSSFQECEQKVGDLQILVQQFQAKESEYRNCQYNLAGLTQKHDKMKTENASIAQELDSSRMLVDRLDAKVEELKTDRDELHHVMEEVDHWVESSMRRRIWDPASWQDSVNRGKERSKVFARSVTAATKTHISAAAGKFSGQATAAGKKVVGRAADAGKKIGSRAAAAGKKFSHEVNGSWLIRTWNRGRCSFSTLVGKVTKKGGVAPSCTMGGN